MARTIRKITPPKLVLPKRKRVAAYARVSTGKEAMLHSLSAQISYYSSYIQKRSEWEYVGAYADEAMTGTKDDRPEFQRLLADCRAGMIDLIITKSISRFARNTVTLLTVVRELKEMGISVFFEKEGLYSDSGQGEMILTLLASVAQEESRAVSENCKWRIRRRFQNGELVSLRDMYGYNITKKGIEINPEQAAVVRWVFNEYLKGRGCFTIAKILRETGIPTYRGYEWTVTGVMKMLHNEKYVGNALLQKKYVSDHLTKRLVMNKGQLPMYYAEGTHPAIIDIDTFDSVQRLLEENRIKNSIDKNTPPRYPFSGKIVCGNCGHRFQRKVTRSMVAWNCETYLRKGKAHCPAKQIPEDTLMAIAAEVLKLPAFDEHEFQSNIKEIRVTDHNTVAFLFYDGLEVLKGWQDKSRRDSWNTDARKRASESGKKRGKTYE